MDDDVAALYKNDRRIAMVYAIFACIGIIIICLGLFGISLFDIRQRYREIAIRKVNGALVKDLYLLLGCKYLVVLGSAFAVSIPLSCYLIYQYTKAPCDKKFVKHECLSDSIARSKLYLFRHTVLANKKGITY